MALASKPHPAKKLKKLPTKRFILLAIVCISLWLIDMATGSYAISIADMWDLFAGHTDDQYLSKIIFDIRLPKSIAALLVGAALSVSGLQMQTLFRNPLAGPYVLGISAGASLGVALLMLGGSLLGGSLLIRSFGIAGAAWLGAAAVLFIIGLFSTRIKDIMVILILGMMLSSGISAIVQILQYTADENALKGYVIWTMGSLGEVTRAQLPLLTGIIVVGLILALVSVKALNLHLLGEDYAKTMGLNVGRSRNLIFLSTSLLAGCATAFCGPIGFIGLAIPHVARMLFNNADHRILLPATILTGASSLLLCDILARLFTIPINAVTALLGIPVIIYVVLKYK